MDCAIPCVSCLVDTTPPVITARYTACDANGRPFYIVHVEVNEYASITLTFLQSNQIQTYGPVLGTTLDNNFYYPIGPDPYMSNIAAHATDAAGNSSSVAAVLDPCP